MAKFLTAVLRDETSGNVIGVLPVPEKRFSTGREGYHGQGKIEVDGVRFQAQVQLVRIGSPEDTGREVAE